MAKYHNRRTCLDGLTFDSAAEAARHAQLVLMERTGLVRELKRQVAFELLPAELAADGRKLRALKYVADFTYLDRSGRLHVEDVKGVRTPVYKLKKRLMWHIYRIEIEET